jgi:hypothetical protein
MRALDGLTSRDTGGESSPGPAPALFRQRGRGLRVRVRTRPAFTELFTHQPAGASSNCCRAWRRPRRADSAVKLAYRDSPVNPDSFERMDRAGRCRRCRAPGSAPMGSRTHCATRVAGRGDRRGSDEALKDTRHTGMRRASNCSRRPMRWRHSAEPDGIARASRAAVESDVGGGPRARGSVRPRRKYTGALHAPERQFRRIPLSAGHGQLWLRGEGCVTPKAADVLKILVTRAGSPCRRAICSHPSGPTSR